MKTIRKRTGDVATVKINSFKIDVQLRKLRSVCERPNPVSCESCPFVVK